MQRKYSVESSELKFIGLSYFIIDRYYKWFAELYPEDAWQIVMLCALEAEPFETTREASNAIQREIRQSLNGYGWHIDPLTRKWVNPERTRFIDGFAYKNRRAYLDAIDIDPCGVGGCRNPGIRNDERYVKLCRRHSDYIYRRRRNCETDIYAGIESFRRFSKGKPIVWLDCAVCKTRISRTEWRIKNGTVFFCSNTCKIKQLNACRNTASGSRHGLAKLNEMSVKVIKNQLALGQKPCQIAKVFAVDPKTIYLIRDGKTWRNVGV